MAVVGSWTQEIEYFVNYLNGLTDQRDNRHILDPATGLMGWYHFELLEMWLEVNRRRMNRGWREIPMSKVEQAEQQASGHVDYTKKYALGCAGLAYTEG